MTFPFFFIVIPPPKIKFPGTENFSRDNDEVTSIRSTWENNYLTKNCKEEFGFVKQKNDCSVP